MERYIEVRYHIYGAMRAAVLQEHGEPLEITEVDAPDATAEGAVIELEACGVCRSDWHGWMGDWDWLGIQPQPGQILGHEPAGRVSVPAVAECRASPSRPSSRASRTEIGRASCRERV